MQQRAERMEANGSKFFNSKNDMEVYQERLGISCCS